MTLTQDPKASIERTITIFRRKIQTQYLILAGSLATVLIGSLLLPKENQNEARWNH